jgi:small-conductance mechanosensitive channel
LLRRGHIERRPSQLAGTLVAYVVLGLAILTALGALGLDFLAATLNQVYLYAPRAFVGIVILFLGTAAAGLLAEATKRSLLEAGVTRGAGLPSFVRYSVLFVTVLLTATVLQIEVTILIVMTAIILGGLTLTAVLALGLGLRDLSKQIAASRYVAEGLVEGDLITIDGRSGTIERIGYAVTTIRDSNGVNYLIPNAYFLEHIVAKLPPEVR